MDLAPPTLDPPADVPSPSPAPAPPATPRGRIVGGVGALLASRLGVDALWIRLLFVVLTLVSGVGIIAYAACWLALVVGPRRPGARIAGGVLLVAGVPFVLLASGDGPFISGPWAILLLLGGLAAALWQPRRPARADVAPLPEARSEAASAPIVDAAPRERSPLGRLVLGVAVVVAAGGALIDQANGGRLHPEQWLGAAAMVCGAGLVAGAFVGRGRWLVVPAVLFAGTGFLTGQAARLGLDGAALTGTHWLYVGPSTPSGAAVSQHVVAGSIGVQIEGAPTEPVTVDARVAFGDIRVHVEDGVTVEIRADSGRVRVMGVERPDGTLRIGPEGQPDVVVMARVGVGEIVVEQFTVPEQPAVPPRGPELAPGVSIGAGGTVVLAGGEAVLGADGEVLVGDSAVEGQVVVVITSIGEFRVLPDRQLLTPDGQVFDLPGVRLPPARPALPTVPVSPTQTTTDASTVPGG